MRTKCRSIATFHRPIHSHWSQPLRGRDFYIDARGLQRDVVYLGWPIAPSSISPKGGWRGGCAGSQPMSTAVHRSPNKLWRSNSIYNLWFTLLTSPELPDVIHENPRDESNCSSCWHHSQLFQSLLVRRHPKISKNRPPEQKYFFLQIVVVEHSRSGLTVQKFERAISLRFLGIILGVLRLEVSVWIS